MLLVFRMPFKPRDTIRRVNAKRYSLTSFVLASLVDFGYCLDKAASKSAGDLADISILLPVCLVGGIPYGMLLISVWCVLLYTFGKVVGGRGTYLKIFNAASWSSIPVVLGLILWVPEWYLFGGYELFQSDMPTLAADPDLVEKYIYFVWVEMSLPVVWLIIMIPSLSEVQNISIGKAILNILIPFIVIGAPALWIMKYNII